jgi:hypothetical protein
MKTSELTGAALDWAVAKCEGFVKVAIWTDHIGICKKYSFEDQVRWAPSTNWAQGGPIIEGEGIEVSPDWVDSLWRGYLSGQNITAYGPTPLIAAMRCYVSSELGDEVDVPEELI